MRVFDPDFFANNLSFLRKQKGLKQYELADQVGENRQKITNYENGNSTPPISVLVKIANVLQVSMDKLLFGKESTYVPIDQNVVDAVAEEQARYFKSIEHENEVIKTRVEDLRRELNTLRAYTARLEKDIARYEDQEDKNSEQKAG